MTIGERIAKCRKEKNLSQEYIAELLDVSRQAVSKWENGLTEPDTGNLIHLASLLGVTVEYLACGSEQGSGTVPQKESPPARESLTLFGIIGIILISLGAASVIFGICHLWEFISIGILLAIYGTLVITLKRDGAMLSASMLILAVAMIFILGYTVGLDVILCCIIFAISVIVPLLIYGVIIGFEYLIRGRTIVQKAKKLVVTGSVGVFAVILSVSVIITLNVKEAWSSSWFSEETLTPFSLTGLPMPESETMLKLDGEDGVKILALLDTDSYNDYLAEVYGYLITQGFRHLGTRGQELREGTYELRRCDKLSDFQAGEGVCDYLFVYNVGATPFIDGEVNCYVLSIDSVTKYVDGAAKNYTITLDGKTYTYNTVISIYPEFEDENYKLKGFNITYDNGANRFVDCISEALPGREVTVTTRAIDDADIVVYVNGVKIDRTAKKPDLWEYTFIMPKEDVHVTYRIIDIN